ncbi:hypothetical protein RJ640_014964, partial [Escallonia rubra]
SSSRPQKKATAHHRKTGPRKTKPWDVRRGPRYCRQSFLSSGASLRHDSRSTISREWVRGI